MKKRVVIAMALVMGIVSVQAQSSYNEVKSIREIVAESSDSQVQNEIVKAIDDKKATMSQQEYTIINGVVSLDDQIKTWCMRNYEFNSDLFPIYIQGDGTGTGLVYNEIVPLAKKKALKDLKFQVRYQATKWIEYQKQLGRLTPEQCELAKQKLAANTDYIEQSIVDAEKIIEAYHMTGNHSYKEVMIGLSCSGSYAEKAAKAAVDGMLNMNATAPTRYDIIKSDIKDKKDVADPNVGPLLDYSF